MGGWMDGEREDEEEEEKREDLGCVGVAHPAPLLLAFPSTAK